jgi:CubicO group peptidase (beta-lactamase class C family)
MPSAREALRHAWIVEQGGKTTERLLGREYAPDRLVEWGSITKVVTALTVRDLANRDLLDLESPLHETLDVNLPSSVTYARVLSHTSGLERMHPGAPLGFRGDPYRDTTAQDVLTAMSSGVCHSTDRVDTHDYSNLGYALLGIAICRVTGKQWMDVARETILAPAGLDSATFDPPRVLRTAHTTSFGTRRHAWDLAQSAYASAGGLWSTLDDLVLFGRNCLENPELYTSPAWVTSEPDVVWHNGATRYANACLIVGREDRSVVVAHTMSGVPGSADRLAWRGRRLLS